LRIATINLSDRIAGWLDIEEATHREFLGGAGLGAKILYPLLTEAIDPFSPEAPLLVLTGPLTGTIGPAVGRYVICAKSPQTGLWGESNVGGYFGPELRAAGFDGLIITGCAEPPVYLWINEGTVTFMDAKDIWGKSDTYETQGAIRKQLKDNRIRIAAIGLAGENRIPFASVLCDHGRLAGRTGMGAVFGAKNLKAIAVRGTGDIPLAEPERYAEIRTEVNRGLRSDPVTLSLRAAGTSSAADYFDYLGEVPKKYFTTSKLEGSDQVTGSAMAETILSGVSACHGCVIACGRKIKLEDGVERKGPEYETIIGFGPNLGINNLPSISEIGELCDRYGMDTISLSNIIGLAFLLYEKGYLPKAVHGDLEWGNVNTVRSLVHLTARREGFGRVLAEGAASLASTYGAGELAVQVNGLEIPYHDPRGFSGMAVVYLTSPRGACHNQGDYYLVDTGQSMEQIGVDFFDRQGGAEKSASIARNQDWRTVCNSLVLCLLANIEPDDVVRLISSATGFDYDLDKLLQIGERAWNLKRILNYKLGLQQLPDSLPAGLMVPLSDGASSGYVPPVKDLLAAYYEARDWDPVTTMPTKTCLKRLDLEFTSYVEKPDPFD
jgi:aldehyde:ferredoxin oxidoreductase